MPSDPTTNRSKPGRYGRFGGRYVAEAIWTPLQEIAATFEQAVADEAFMEEFQRHLNDRLGRPTPVSLLTRISEGEGGGRLWLKREDLCQGGSFCGNLAVAYGLLARRMGREWLIGDTATGDFGIALGAIGNALGLKTRVFIGREDAEQEEMQVRRMDELGVKVERVDTHSRGRKAACAEALRFWATHSAGHLYCSSSLAAPDPFPRMIAYFLSVIGAEAGVQLARRQCRPFYLIAPVGSGGFAAGLFSEFVGDEEVQLVGVQAAAEGLEGRHSASIVAGRPGVLHGTHSFLLQDADGQVARPASIAGGLAMAHVGPQHARWAETGRVHYVPVENVDAIRAVRRVMVEEGINVSLESGHALAYALKLLPTLSSDRDVVVGISGAGMRDIERIRRRLEEEGES
ncbi:MAG: pyridoxal-phosphate dependent enzyme [Myxococcota bacterium]